MRHRRTRAVGCIAILAALTSCGSGSGSGADGAAENGSTGPTSPPAAAASPAGEDVTPTPDQTVEPGPAAPATADSARPVEPPVADPTPPGTTSTETTPAEAGPAEAVVGGRLLAAEVRPEAELDSNPFPDLVVDDVGKDAQVNIRNILPSDRPVLLWAWAPH
ncbi:MAG: hypothetical protein ABJH68_11690 [Ilumatobacter sp.]|uniref:hypothetical protein n=1 Tax=Ilumatobacter sp. TaxID=1967498 RepID=UPI00329818AB